MLYLLIDLFVIIIPLVFSFHPRIRFDKEWRFFFPANLLTGMLFVSWDIWFTAQGVWDFNPAYVTGITWLGLPMEEILFFFCIPYACMFTLHAIQNIYPEFRINWRKMLVLFLILLSACISVIFTDRIYTLFSFGTFAVILLITWLVMKEKTDHFFLMYLIILLPFFIVNGILTGSWIEGEVVSYNNAENLGIRMLTIPVEDAFYGMTLLMLHFLLMEVLKRIRPQRTLPM